LKDDLIAEGIAEAKITVCMLGCDTGAGAADELPPRLGLLLPATAQGRPRPFVVFAGTMSEDRGLEQVLDMVARLAEEPLSFVLCGDGPARPKLENLAREKGLLGTSVIFTGAIPRNDLQTLLRFALAALADCSPDARGGFLLDALAAGKPAIMMGHGWQRDLVEGRGAGVSLPANAPEAAARELSRFLTDADGLRRAGQQASALAAGRFNLERIAAEYRSLIEEAVAADPRAAVLRRRTLRAKRGLDVAISLAGLSLLSLLLLVLVLAIRVKMGAPAFFTQQRTGLNGRFFKLVKLRTMSDGKGPDGRLLDDAPREVLAPHVAGRTAGTPQCPEGRHEPGGAAPAAARVPGLLHPRTAAPARGEAGAFGLGAGERTQCAVVGGAIQTRCLVRRQPELLA
jgi:hypothetical protein